LFRNTPGESPGPGPVDAGGRPRAWVLALEPLYRSQIAYFAQDLAYNLFQLDRPELARRLMDASVAIDPRQQWPCLLLVESCRELGDWHGVRVAFERASAAVPARALDPALADAYVEALEKTGEPARARSFGDSLARVRRAAGEGPGR